MLILGRKLKERVRLTVNGVTIWVEVNRIAANDVRIGITAPPRRGDRAGRTARARRPPVTWMSRAPGARHGAGGFSCAPMEFRQCGELNTATAST